MSLRMIKHSSEESGKFDKSNNRISWEVDTAPGYVYDFSRSYIIMNTSVSTEDKCPNKDGVHNVHFGDDVTGEKYRASALVRNSGISTDKYSNLEWNRDVNFYQANVQHYKKDYNHIVGSEFWQASGEQDYILGDRPSHPFLDQLSYDNDAEYVAKDIIIPLQDIYPGLGSKKEVPYLIGNTITFKVELDDTANDLFDEYAMVNQPEIIAQCDDLTAVGAGDARKRVTSVWTDYKSTKDISLRDGDLVVVFYTDAASGKYTHVKKTLAGAGVGVQLLASGALQFQFTANTWTQGNDYSDIEVKSLRGVVKPASERVLIDNFGAGQDIITTANFTTASVPFWKGQAIDVFYMDANAESQVTTRKITGIAIAGAPGPGKATLTLDGAAFVDGNTVAFVTNNRSPIVNYTINRADLVMFEIDASQNPAMQRAMKGGVDFPYMKLEAIPFNRASLDVFEKVYNLHTGVQKVFILNKIAGRLLSEDDYLESYRLSVNSVPTTDRVVVPYSPVHIDRLMRALGSSFKYIRYDDRKVIGELIQTNDPQPMLEVVQNSNKVGDLQESIIYVYSLVAKVLKL